jgi:hypothetical protein
MLIGEKWTGSRVVSVAADADDASADGVGRLANVNASNFQGAQFGDHNVQHNHYNEVASLGNLAPHHALERIRAMGHDGAVDQLANAEAGATAKVLDVLLNTDEALAVSLLADISRVKAEKLITLVSADVPGREWLRQLPAAAEAIGNRGTELKWTGGRLERAEYYRPVPNFGRLLARKGPRRVSSQDYHQGYRRIYKDGQVYWREGGGARAITGAILNHYVSSGECGGQFGFPASEATPITPAVGQRWVQRFSSGAIYCHESGVIPVAQEVVEYLGARGGVDHFYPLGMATEATSLHGARGWMQRFREPGNASSETVYYDIKWAYGVSGEIESFYNRLRGTSSQLGFPMSNATPPGSNLTQDFEGGTVFTGIPGVRVVVVPAESMRLIQVESIRQRLGLPIADEQPAGSSGDRLQFFENGVVTLRDGKREVWVRPNAMGLGSQARLACRA